VVGGGRVVKWAVSDLQELILHMHDLAALDAKRYPPPPKVPDLFDMLAAVDPADQRPWSEQTRRVYTTMNGTRVICTSMPFPLDSWRNRHDFTQLARFLGVDPLYATKCVEQECYRARLTPKAGEGHLPVCIDTLTACWGKRVPQDDLLWQILLHDQVTTFQSGIAARDIAALDKIQKAKAENKESQSEAPHRAV
jgi:hypothetical protein